MALETDFPERVLALAGVQNFRDYGGYAAQDGRLRTGRLYRSAQHRDADDADLARIAGLDLRAVIDLRGGAEREASPCRRAPDFAARVVFVPGDTAGLAPHLAAAGEATGPAEARAALARGYAEMPFRPNLTAALRLYFEALATEDGPTLVHCAAGKDRTGFAVATFHALMGVHHDDLVADYMLTQLLGRQEARLPAVAASLRKSLGIELGDDAVRELMSVRPEFIDAAFKAIRDRHGDVAAYLGAVADVTPERVRAIRERLVV